MNRGFNEDYNRHTVKMQYLLCIFTSLCLNEMITIINVLESKGCYNYGKNKNEYFQTTLVTIFIHYFLHYIQHLVYLDIQ